MIWLSLLTFYLEPIKFEPDQIDHAYLPAQGEQRPPAGTRCWTAGWGKLKWFGKTADVLQEVDLKLFGDNEECGFIFFYFLIQKNHLLSHLKSLNDTFKFI